MSPSAETGWERRPTKEGKGEMQRDVRAVLERKGGNAEWKQCE